MEPLVVAEPAVGFCSQEGTGDFNTVSTSGISGSVYGNRELKEESRLLTYKQAPQPLWHEKFIRATYVSF